MDPDTHAPLAGKTYYFFPELFPAESCKRIRDKQGSFMYSMLYLNNPKDPALAEFKSDDLRYYTFDDERNILLEHGDGSREAVPLDVLVTVLFWDPAMSEQERKKNSRNAMVVMGKDPKDRLFILDAWAEWQNPTLLFSRFISFHKRYNIRTAAIEDVGFQRTLKFPLFAEMKRVGDVFHVEEQRPIGSKDARIRSLIPYVETHQLFIRRGLLDFLEELKAFPVFKTKDLVDAAAACLPLFGLGSVQSYNQKLKSATNANSRLASRSTLTGY
jgi:predicted phage terminase large subunit-like protein